MYNQPNKQSTVQQKLPNYKSFITPLRQYNNKNSNKKTIIIYSRNR